MYLKRFYDENLAHASYLVGCQATGEAIVIDASRSVRQYIEDATSQELVIVAAAETHIHADYLSGSRQLAHEINAKLYLSKEGGKDWQYQFATKNDELVGDGDVIKVGNLTFEVMHTPGHTPEHISFILTDHPASDKPVGVFTGDFIFVGDVGRPDLLEKAANIKNTMKKGAEDLFESLKKFAKLPDHLQIWPAHGAGSACGKALGAVPMSVLGYEKLSNWAFRIKDKEDFVKAVLEDQPEPPKYFAQMKKLNKIGPPLIPSMVSKTDIQKLPSVCTSQILIDLRGADAFAASHPKGALYLPPGKSLVTWAGWLLPYDQDLYLLVEDAEQAAHSIRALQSIGLDQVAGFFEQSELNQVEYPCASSRRIEAEEVEQQTRPLLDVRSEKEWKQGHLEGAVHIHLGYLKDRLDEVPEEPIVYCGGGTRSLIASSILQASGLPSIDVVGSYRALEKKMQMA